MKVRAGMLVRKRRRFFRGYGDTYKVKYIDYGEVSGDPLRGSLWHEWGPSLKYIYLNPDGTAKDPRWEEVRREIPDLGGDYCECCDPDIKWCRNRAR